MVTRDDRVPTARELLLAARARLTSPGAWVRGQADPDVFAFAIAVDVDGRSCAPSDARAVRWNLCGAIVVGACQHGSEDELFSALRRLCVAVGVMWTWPVDTLLLVLSDWHDARGRTHTDVLAALDLAAGGTAS